MTLVSVNSPTSELQALDDRTLNDMALNRAGLPGVAREAAGYR